MRRYAVAVPLLAVLALAGCGTPAVTPTPTPAALGKITTIDSLVTAVTDAGMVCNWQQTDQVTAAVASGTCTDTTVLMMFSDASATQARVADLKAGQAKTMLVGDNWIVNSPDATGLEPALGGEIVVVR